VKPVTDIAYRRLGNSGLAVSSVGLGCNNFGGRMSADQVPEVVNTALDLGINLFDTADVYRGSLGESEQLLGAALGKRRDDAVIATKFGGNLNGDLGADYGARGSRRYIARAAEASLRRLGTDYIDLYQIHAPDPHTPIEETLAALHDLVRSGKVRYLGNSNFAGWQIADAAWTARTAHLTPFISAQNYYSLLTRDAEAEVVPACQRFGLGILPYFPLESGLLSGKYRRGEPAPAGARLSAERFAARVAEADWDTIERLERFAAERGVTLLDVAIGGLAARPGVVSVIAGATTAEQVQANVAAGNWRPAGDELDAVLGARS
jgi:aryl-alcohol dehydrogenase-like predicted oxidoreductase